MHEVAVSDDLEDDALIGFDLGAEHIGKWLLDSIQMVCPVKVTREQAKKEACQEAENLASENASGAHPHLWEDAFAFMKAFFTEQPVHATQMLYLLPFLS